MRFKWLSASSVCDHLSPSYQSHSIFEDCLGLLPINADHSFVALCLRRHKARGFGLGSWQQDWSGAVRWASLRLEMHPSRRGHRNRASSFRCSFLRSSIFLAAQSTPDNWKKVLHEQVRTHNVEGAQQTAERRSAKHPRI